MTDIAVRVTNISKRYRIGAREQGYKTFREAIVDAVKSPFDNLKNLRSLTKFSGDDGEEDIIWALRDINFEIRRGEVVGIIGANGAGKSTLLKILSRITEPTTGQAEIRGRVSSLLEVGTGFHPELTGRENIYLNGTVLGMRKKEIDHKFNEIVEFSGVEKFIDTPVKRYSSGMTVRLAFAVAAHLEPEILIIDEVLSVGDAAFQKKCLGKMGEIAKGGRTVLFVSHNMAAVRTLCGRAVCLESGKILADGESKEIVSIYLDNTLKISTKARSNNNFSNDDSGGILRIENVVLSDANGKANSRFSFGSGICVEVYYFASKRIERPYFWIGIGENDSTLFMANNLLDGARPEYIEGRGIIKCFFYEVKLLPRYYNVYMGARDNNGVNDIFPSTCMTHFEVVASPQELGLKGQIADAFIRTVTAPVFSPYVWELPDGRQVKVCPETSIASDFN